MERGIQVKNRFEWKAERLRAVEAWELERGPREAANGSRLVVTWPRSPHPLATLLRGNAFDVARAGYPSPFSTLGGRRSGS